jgi:glycerophosphoryl diester phosphodiesterase
MTTTLTKAMTTTRRPWIIAHRGASAYAPENTVAAFRRAVEMGAGFIETDLHLTRDARFVAIHDATLERTTNGRGAVRDFTLAQLRELDAGAWFDAKSKAKRDSASAAERGGAISGGAGAAKFAGERIPTLEEILEFAREANVAFYLEIKADAARGAENIVAGALVAALADALRGPQETARAIVISFHAELLTSIRQRDAALMTGLLVEKGPADAVKRALQVGALQLAPRRDMVTPALIERAHDAELCVVPWTINEPAEMRAAIAAGVDGIMTDYPDRLAALVKG